MTQLNAQALMAMPYEQMVACIKSWNRNKMEESHSWRFWRRNDQFEPQGDWRTWLVMAGRGYGKTRMGAEWVSALATQYPGARFALVGATLNEARQVMVEGESGLLALPFAERPEWEPSLRRLTWRNGATGTLFSAAEPESLRGPQHDFAWADEIAKWPSGIKAWDNLMLGLRLGERPRAMATTTPRPVPLVRRLNTEKGVAVTHGRTMDNNMHLPPDFIASVRAIYAGTRLGRQELDGELIADAAGALWSRDLLERQRASAAPELKRVVIGVGVVAVLLYLAGLTYGPLKPYRETFRIVVLVAIAVYIVYTFLLQNKESDDRAELESQMASLEANNRALEQAKSAADSQLAAAQTELHGLRAALANAGLDAPVAGAATKKAVAPKKAAAPKKPAAKKPAAGKTAAAAKKPAAPRTPKAE